MKNYIKKIGVVCPGCGSTNTYTNTKNHGKTLVKGLYCANCGNAYTDGTEPITAADK